VRYCDARAARFHAFDVGIESSLLGCHLEGATARSSNPVARTVILIGVLADQDLVQRSRRAATAKGITPSRHPRCNAVK
jgi:hypothetical protein